MWVVGQTRQVAWETRRNLTPERVFLPRQPRLSDKMAYVIRRYIKIMSCICSSI